MRRRTLIAAAGTAVAGALTPRAAMAGGPTGGNGPATFDIENLGLPVITEGRLRNYVFVEIRLTLAAGQDQNVVRAKAPHLRDAVVKAAHRTPFARAGDWNSLDARLLSAAVMRTAAAVVGRAVVARVDLTSQTARRRVRAPSG